MLVNPIYGGGEASPTIYANNVHISDTTQYITAQLSTNIPENTWVVVALDQPSIPLKCAVIVKYTSGTITVAIPGEPVSGGQTVGVNVTLTNSTVAASWYSGAWRNIFCKVSEFVGDISQIYDET